MKTPEAIQIMVNEQRTGIVGLKEVLESVAVECSSETDEIIREQPTDRAGDDPILGACVKNVSHTR